MPINFRQWVGEFRDNWERSPPSAVLQAGYYTYLGGWLSLTSRPRFQLGTNVYDRTDEWDLLIVLDACRVDALRRVAPEFDFLPRSSEIGSMWSLGSASTEWLCKTFTTDHRREIRETAYLSANPYVTRTFDEGVYAPPKAAPFGFARRNLVDADDFALLYRLYETAVDPRYNMVLPEDTTNATIAAGRDDAIDADRYIAHYMQPHTPYYTRARAENRDLTKWEKGPWSALRRGEITFEAVWEMYLETLRDVCRSVGRLLENFDAEKVVITADHGEMLGTWGIGSHPTGLPHPEVKRVPWAVTSATDSGTYRAAPLETNEDRAPQQSIEDQLEALGYK